MKSSKSRIAVLLTLVLAFVCSIVLSVFSFAMAEVTPATLADVSIYTRGSAAVRIPDSEKPEETMGLRFTAVMKKDQYDALQANVGENVEEGDNYAYKAVSFGMVILPKDYADIVPVTEASLFGQGGEKRYQWTNKDNDTENQAYIINFETPTLSNLADYNELSDIDVVGFHGSIVNIKNGVNSTTNNIGREFISVSYIAVTAQDDTVTYKLATETILPNEEPVEGQLARTVAEVAYQTIKDDTNDVSVENKALMQAHYLDMLKYDVVVKDGEEVISTQKVSYGADVEFNEAFANKEIAYKIRESFVGLKDGENVVTKIEKVTSNKELTAEYGEEEVVIADATDGIKNFKNNAGVNNSAWDGMITASTDVVYGGEDASTKFEYNATSSANNYIFYTNIERYVPMEFESWGFKFKVVTRDDGNAFSATLTLGSGDGIYTSPNRNTEWHEVKVVTTSTVYPRTFDMYVDGSETPISGTYGGTFTPFSIKLTTWLPEGAEKTIALYLSDIVGYTAEGKKALIYNNGGLDDVGMLDVYKMVDENSEITYKELFLDNASIRATRTTTNGSSSHKANDMLETGRAFNKINGTVISGVSLKNTVTVTQNMAIESTSTTVLNDFANATISLGTDETLGTADDKVYNLGADETLGTEDDIVLLQPTAANVKIEKVAHSIVGQENAIAISKMNASTYVNLYLNTQQTNWTNYNMVSFKIDFSVAGSTNKVCFDGSNYVAAPAEATSVTVLFIEVGGDNVAIYGKFSTETKFTEYRATRALKYSSNFYYFQTEVTANGGAYQYFSNVYGG